MRILIAEDDPVSRRLLQALLTKWGYEVIVTTDGKQAWEVLQREDAPRLAILDWMMPEMDGPEVCRMVRSKDDGAYVYLLLLTAKSQKDDIIRGIGAGADDYVTKPFDANELNARLRAGRRIIDLQAELVSARESLLVQATHDPLTGLPNRLLFSDRLTQRLMRSRYAPQPLAVMYLDLDRFKLVNDTLGHSMGDRLLQSVAQRLSDCLRATDTLARMGGDEFTIILADIETHEEAASVARKILEMLAEPVVIEANEFFVTASIGISVFPIDGTDVETLVKNADTAMYRAKEQGRNCYHAFTESLNASAVQAMALEAGLRRALDRKEFVVHYQPRVDIKTGRIVGSEALVRWQHPEYGLVSPNQFISLAEDTGLIGPISEYVIETACKQTQKWMDAGCGPLSVSVNISGKQFQQRRLSHSVQYALEQSGMDARHLDLELTESTLMTDPDAVISVLQEFRDMGIKISVDDFGTGYSSLSYLKRFPVDAVKIDRSFVMHLTTNPDDAAIAGAVVAMAHSLKLKVCAEGVETIEQLEFLRSLQCDEMQGYFISPPVAAQEFDELLWQNGNRDKGSRMAA